jgi:hypothetical protein
VISPFREKFNAETSQATYQSLVTSLESVIGYPIEFRISETPVFLPSELTNSLIESARAINSQLLNKNYLSQSDRAVPANYFAPNETPHPTFIQTDFAVTRDANGKLTPKLVELQGCASMHMFQMKLSQAYQKYFDLQEKYLLSDLNDKKYLELLRRAICGKHSPEEVVLMEIEPERQKTRPDFTFTEQEFGIKVVDISQIIKRGKQLFYWQNGKETQILRIYNRVIVDELIQKNISFNFDYRDELEVEWAGHPNWFFRLSKFSLPFLDHPSVPRSWFLNQLEAYPKDLENFVLKPLFSFAGSGVKINVISNDLDAISEAERSDYLLQEKISYDPVIQTADDPAKIEIRVMFIWPDEDAEPTPTMLLARMSKGAMMGVDFNKNKTWVGASAGFLAE